MSRRVIDASVAFARSKAWPICLIASRRQIDAAALGGGYVDGLSTEDFSADLKEAVASGVVVLARDHGGPYQRVEEAELSLPDALDKVELSYQTDIASGFSILHIDPEKCIAPGDPDGFRRFGELTRELLGRCFDILDETGHDDVRFEIGSDEGIGMGFVPDQWAEFIEDIQVFCAKRRRPDPIAIAVPLGTKVKETENVGGFALDLQDVFWLKRIQAMHDIAAYYGIKLKLHNADYVAADVLKRYRELGVEQINVAPELGVVETRALLEFLRRNHMEKEVESFLDIAYQSRKWERWLLPDSKSVDEDKAVIAGHYVFSTPRCRALLQAISARPSARGLDDMLMNAITDAIERYYTVLEIAHEPLQNVSA